MELSYPIFIVSAEPAIEEMGKMGGRDVQTGKCKLAQAEEPNLFAHLQLVYPLCRNTFVIKQEEQYEGDLTVHQLEDSK